MTTRIRRTENHKPSADLQNETLVAIIRATGIPLGDEATVEELNDAVQLCRDRRRASLLIFLARVVAKDLYTLQIRGNDA